MAKKTPLNPAIQSADAYQRLVRHERGLWMTTIAIVIMSAITIAILTTTAALAGTFDGPGRGFLLAGGSLVLLGAFIAYVGFQRQALEENRSRILNELQSRSSQLTEANEALEEALSVQETFLSCVSHELKTPLTCMMGYADFLASGRIDPEDVPGHARSVVEEGRALNELIDRILDITRLRTGKLQLDRVRTDVEGVVAAAIENTRKAAESKGMSVIGDLKQGPLEALVDTTRVRESMETLIRHALERSPESAKVFVHTRPVGKEWVEVSVEDQGPRVPRTERSAIFKMFAGVDPTPHGRSGDLGLTLPLVQQVIMAHGGDIYAQEVGIRGLRFRILLPRHHHQRPHRQAALGQPGPEQLKESA